MSFWKRAFLYVMRKRGKSILLFVILLIMATFVLTGLAVGKASEAAQENLRQSLGGEFKVMVNYSEDNPYFRIDKEESEMGTMMIVYSEMNITNDIIEAIMGTEGIAYYDASSECLLNPEGIRFIPGNIPIDEEFRNMTNTQIVGGTKTSDYFLTGKVSLIEGRHIESTDSHVAAISKDLAEKNGLSIGDSLTLHGEGTTNVEIIGIFEINEERRFVEQVTSYDKLENKIFLDVESLQSLLPNYMAGFDTALFKVNDPAQLDDIVQQVKNLSSVDWRVFTLETNNQIYLDTVTPLSKLDTLVTTLLIVIVAVSAVILSLILTMWSKSRIHETGVFLSVGIRKSAIIGQYLVEVLLIAILAFGLSYFTSNAISNQLGNSLLQQSVQEATMPENDVGNAEAEVAVPGVAANGEENTSPEEVKHIQVSIDLDNMIQLYLIGFAVLILSVGASSAVVMRLKPREILSKMS